LRWCQARRINAARASAADVLAYRQHLIAARYKTASIRGKITVLSQLYRALQSAGARPDNPAEGIGAPRETHAAEDFPFLDEGALQHLLSILPDRSSEHGRRDRSLVFFMALHGLRTVEIQRASVEDLRHRPEGTALLVHGKGRRDRMLWLRPDVAAELGEYLRARSQVQADRLGTPLFAALGNRAGGERLSRRGIRKIVDGYLKASGLKSPGLSGHALRHTAATLAYRHTRDLRAVQVMLGHRNPETTSRYARLVDGPQNNPALSVPICLSAP
jgi:integrase/recombinase XerD